MTKKKYYADILKDIRQNKGKHKECEWSYCEQNTSIHVHHILALNKYPESADGNYHGGVGNNFISYCPFHHYAYHFVHSTKRNDKTYRGTLDLLWANTEKWAEKNKIQVEDFEIELAQMLPAKVILKRS